MPINLLCFAEDNMHVKGFFPLYLFLHPNVQCLSDIVIRIVDSCILSPRGNSKAHAIRPLSHKYHFPPSLQLQEYHFKVLVYVSSDSLIS